MAEKGRTYFKNFATKLRFVVSHVKKQNLELLVTKEAGRKHTALFKSACPRVDQSCSALHTVQEPRARSTEHSFQRPGPRAILCSISLNSEMLLPCGTIFLRGLILRMGDFFVFCGN